MLFHLMHYVAKKSIYPFHCCPNYSEYPITKYMEKGVFRTIYKSVSTLNYRVMRLYEIKKIPAEYRNKALCLGLR